MIRDNAAIAIQLGQSPEEAARATIVLGDMTPPLTEANDIVGPYTAAGNTDEWGARHGDLLTRIMAADFSAITDEYDRACQVSLPGGQDVHGTASVDAFWMGVRSAFPSATFRIEHQIGRHDPMLSPRSAVRWSLSGKHDGWGRYGAPTGADVHVMGVSHAEFGPRGLRRETTLIDDIAIWKQILLQIGSFQ